MSEALCFKWAISDFHQNKPHPHAPGKASSSSPHTANNEELMPSPGAGKNSRGFVQREGMGSRGTCGRKQSVCGLPALGVFSPVLLLPKTSAIVGIKTPSNTVF